MSLQSLARQGKQLHRYARPKPRKPVEQSKPFNVTEFAKTAHKAATAFTPKTRGAFGGCSKANRRQRITIKIP